MPSEGKNKTKCKRYSDAKTFERNKARKLYRHLRRVGGCDTSAVAAMEKYAIYLPASSRVKLQGIR